MKRRILLVVLLALTWSGRGVADDEAIPPKAKAYLDQATEASEARIAEANQVVKRLEEQRKTTSRALVGQLDARIKKAKVDLKTIKNAPLPVPQVTPLAVGKIGTLPGERMRVFQIVGPKEMLIELFYSVNTIPVQERSYIMLLRGMPTAGYADGSRVAIPPAVEVVGNYTHTFTAGSPHTVMVIEAFDLKQVEPFLKKPEKK